MGSAPRSVWQAVHPSVESSATLRIASAWPEWVNFRLLARGACGGAHSTRRWTAPS